MNLPLNAIPAMPAIANEFGKMWHRLAGFLSENSSGLRRENEMAIRYCFGSKYRRMPAAALRPSRTAYTTKLAPST